MSGHFMTRPTYTMVRVRTGATVQVPESSIDRTLLQLASEASRCPVTGQPTVTAADTARAMAWRAELQAGRSVHWTYRLDAVRIDPPITLSRILDIAHSTLRIPGD